MIIYGKTKGWLKSKWIRILQYNTIRIGGSQTSKSAFQFPYYLEI